MIPRFARPYAEALLRTARSTEKAVATRDELRRFAELMERTPALGRLFGNPGVPRATKERIFAAASEGLGLGPLALSFLRLLLANYRLARLPEVLAALDSVLNRRLGVVVAEVTTAEPLAADQESRLAAALGRALGAAVQLRAAVDPSLVAGFVARVDSARFDASLRGQLERLARRLGASTSTAAGT